MTALRLLLADDDPRLVHIVAMYLGMEGFEVVTALDGEQALRHVMSETFDAVILDVMMPGADGISVCRAMRQQPHTRRTPVLIFTALSSVADAERARLAGATHMITKPFSLPGLGAVLHASVGRRELAAT
ncbi:MAG: response regulator [Candidatus Dormibacteraeota bacterium]|nr:response regulator [Candidatus Dormibacteraeota bacterium]